MTDKQDDLIKKLRNLAITKQLNFLIGSGTSYPAIRLMRDIRAENDDERNEILTQEVKNISKKLLEIDLTDEVKKTLDVYRAFVIQLIEILNLSNSRQTPRTVNLFTTNYDLFLEKAIDIALQSHRFVFNDGASGYFTRKLESSNYNRTVSYKGLNDNYTNEFPSVTLIKPHGSMNWEKIDESILIRNYVVENPYVVKPTGKEERDTFLSNHFHEMLRVFQLELDKPQSVLFVIGFSYQDSHIAKMVKRAIQNPELMIYNFAFNKKDKENILKNLNFLEERSNFIILTPADFSDELKNGDSFVLSNLTAILKGISLGDLKDDK